MSNGVVENRCIYFVNTSIFEMFSMGVDRREHSVHLVWRLKNERVRHDDYYRLNPSYSELDGVTSIVMELWGNWIELRPESLDKLTVFCMYVKYLLMYMI